MQILVAVFTLLYILVFSASTFAQTPHLELRSITQNRLTSPDFVTNAHDGSGRLFILQQGGVILVVPPDSTRATVFLDLSDRVMTGTERGLSGLAFHPDFAANRRFFVNYTRKPDGAIVLAEYKASVSNPGGADVAETVLLTIPHPGTEHNGGMLDFGSDGYLYMSTGDGGGSYDPPDNAQNLDSLLGKILRLDIDNPASPAVRYSSPSSNPFYGAAAGRDEIYAYGLRNPFRFSFDRGTQQLYSADVGQDAFEEIDVIEAGGNYGWNVFEGTLCTNKGKVPCNGDDFIGPILDYGHTGRGGRCAITGGYVYRGNKQTFPYGAYIFGDYCTGEIFMLYRGQQQLLLDTAKLLTSFGEDEEGELYAVGGTVDRMVNSGAPYTPTTPFELTTGGSVSFATAGAGDQITVDHVQIQPNDEDARPSALAFIGQRTNGVLISESAVPATSLIDYGRFYAEVGGGADTGAAIANPDLARSAVVSFYFTDAAGNDFGDSALTIPPGGQIAAFLDEFPFSGPSVFNGTVTFISSVPLSVIALRGITNERSEFLTTTLPVVDLRQLGTKPIVIPHFAAGGGWTTDVILLNPTDDPVSGRVQFLSADGVVQDIVVDGTGRADILYSTPARSFNKVRVSGQGATLVGSFSVTPDVTNVAPAVAAVYTYISNGITVTATGALASPEAMELDIYSEVSGGLGAIGSVETGFAIANPSTEEAAVNFEFIGLDGVASGIEGTLRLPPTGQKSSFIEELPGAQALPRPFHGTLRLSSTTPIAALAIRGRYNERGDFLLTTTPPADPAADLEDEAFLPHVVDGAGYTTQIVIFGGGDALTASGNIYFFDQNGKPADPVLK